MLTEIYWQFLNDGLDLIMGRFREDEAGVVDVHVCEDDEGAEQDEPIQQKLVL
jgi:hypothetical protein